VDFEHSINAAVRRLRRALGDSADAPRFIETLHGRGYRLADTEPRSSNDHDAVLNPVRSRLAVLPFSPIANDARPDAFAEGLTEETVAQIAYRCTPAIGVVSRRAVGQFEDDGDAIRNVRDTLQADYVVEGRVRHAHDRVRITSQLIDVADATHMWAEVYERDCADNLSVQKDVAQLIAQAVASRLISPTMPLAREDEPNWDQTRGGDLRFRR
jgi:TolB-like protein